MTLCFLYLSGIALGYLTWKNALIVMGLSIAIPVAGKGKVLGSQKLLFELMGRKRNDNKQK